MTERVPVLLLNGTIGAGKTTIAYECNDALADLEIPNAAVDLDALTAQWPSTSRWNADLLFESLAAGDDLVVVNDDRPVRDIALEVLTKVGWLPSQ